MSFRSLQIDINRKFANLKRERASNENMRNLHRGQPVYFEAPVVLVHVDSGMYLGISYESSKRAVGKRRFGYSLMLKEAFDSDCLFKPSKKFRTNPFGSSW